MTPSLQQFPTSWTEDRATQRCDPSTDPGAETGAGAGCLPAPLPLSPLRDRHQGDKPSRHDAAIPLAGCHSLGVNWQRQEFRFPLNQDTT